MTMTWIRNRALKLPLLACCLASIAGTSDAQTQLDDTWTVTINGQTVAVNPDGSFLVPNVAAADNFGPTGPGSSPDLVGDEFLRLIGTSTSGGRTRWVASGFFQVRSGETFVVRDLTLGERAPVLPAALRLEADRVVIAVGERLQLRTTAVLGDGSEVDVTPRGAFTLYGLSRPQVEIDDEGVLTATKVGPVAVIARNSGAVAVRRIDIVAETTPTTLEGFCELPGGAPAAGAELEASTGARGLADALGFFRFNVEVPRGQSLDVLARLGEGSGLHAARSGPLEVWDGGTTDAGILVLRPASGRLFPNPEFRAETGILRQVDAADMDGDGLLDVIAAGGSGAPGTLSLLRGIPGRLLARAEPHRLDSGILNTFALADLEQDGDLDVLACRGGQGFVVPYLNDGDGGLAPIDPIPAGLFPWSAAAGDLNGDGDPDLAFADAERRAVLVLLGLPGAAFSAPVQYAAGAQPTDLALADLDGDRDLDIAEVDGRFTFTGEEAVSLFSNHGDGTFAPRTILPVPLRPWCIAADDLDGDGDQDLAVGGLGTPATLVLLFNSGSGAFPRQRTFSFAGSIEVAPGDLDGDGIRDLVIGNGTSIEEILLLGGTGGGEFALTSRLPANRIPVSGLVRDLDGDALADMIFGMETGFVSVFPNLGEGRFEADVLRDVGNEPRALIAADLDGDGDVELVTANAGTGGPDLTLLINTGDGSFPSSVALGDSIGATDVAAADIDGDHDLDLAYVRSRLVGAQILILVNNGTAVFTPAPAVAAGQFATALALGDLDGDGLPELIVANNSGRDVWVHKNQAGSFGAPQVHALTSSPRQVRLADTDLDGDLDVVVADLAALTILGNPGNGDLIPAGGYTTNPLVNFIHDVAEGDVDGDGILDIGLAAGISDIVLIQGDGSGGFANERRFAGHAEGIALADLDGEGSIDVISTLTSGQVAFRPGGKTMHLEERLFGVGRGPGRLVVRDLNSDGRLDVAATAAPRTVSILLQRP